MTFGASPPWGPPGPEPTGPQYPYYPQYGPPGYPPQQYPPGETNTLATLSVVFAFLFAPLGALFGHLALGQIRRTLQRGRERALVGLTLSYVFIVLTVLVLGAVLISASNPPGPSVTAGTPDAITPPTMTSRPGTKPPADVSKVLLSVDEVKDIMNTPGLAELAPSPSGGSGDQDAKGDPSECAGVVAPGINTVYDSSGATGFKRASFGDSSTATMVEQVAASFDSPAAARKFVTQNAEQWRQCAGKRFTISANSGTTLAWDIGTPVTTGPRLTVQNTLSIKQEIPQYRIMAAKGSVVIDVGVFSKRVTDGPDTIADRMLARIPG